MYKSERKIKKVAIKQENFRIYYSYTQGEKNILPL